MKEPTKGVILFFVVVIASVLCTIISINSIFFSNENMYYETGILTEPTGQTFKLDGHKYYYDYYYCNEPITSFNNTCVGISYSAGCGQMIIGSIECICSCEC